MATPEHKLTEKVGGADQQMSAEKNTPEGPEPSASPGGGYRPSGALASPPPRAYLVAGTLEPFFRENAARWAIALRDAGADVVMIERAGSHGDAFWREELPLMVAWAFA